MSRYLSLSVVKMLGSGEYALEIPGVETEGHFGLAVRDYTHSTAPNRRFLRAWIAEHFLFAMP